MQIIRGLVNLKTTTCVATIGNFDGMHLAHQIIVKQLADVSNNLNLPSVVISFYPNPATYFGNKTSLLSSFKQRYSSLNAMGADKLLLIKFDKKFANVSAQDFIEQILINKLNVKQMLIGDDFCFGKNRLGDINMLKQHKINAQQILPIYHKNTRISSSNIRNYLAQGDFVYANAMLGRNFNVSGKVIYGQQLGRKIGFPTINIAIKNRKLPIIGVFVVRVKVNNKMYYGVSNIGFKPTVGNSNLSLEVHILNFNKDIYDNLVEIIFDYKIRDEKKFFKIDELIKQIKLDIKIAKKFIEDSKNTV